MTAATRVGAMDYAIFQRRLRKLTPSGRATTVGSAATADELERCEQRLGLALPAPVREMYLNFDGLTVVEPSFRILRLAEFERRSDALIVFCVCDGSHSLAFDASRLNDAEQWPIVNAQTGYCVTQTIGSLLATRMWTWIQQRRPIWYDWHGDSPTRE